MAKGFCSVCGKEVGTLFKPSGHQCTRCLKIFCFDCAKKIGLVFKKPACPECGIALVDSVHSNKDFDRVKREGLL